MSVHPDAALLALCAELRVLQQEWQRLWMETPEEGDCTAADEAWQLYSETTWPGTHERADDSVRRLIDLAATTPEGLQAKAAAIKAIHHAGAYLHSCRDDEFELIDSFLADAAGPLVFPISEAALRA